MILDNIKRISCSFLTCVSTLPLLIVFAWIVLTMCSSSWDAWVSVDDWILSITSTYSNKSKLWCHETKKIDAGYATGDTSVEVTNIEPSMTPSNSALATGLVTMLWCHVIVSSVCYVTSCSEVPCTYRRSSSACGYVWRRRLETIYYGIPT